MAITWAARSRALQAPSSALSAVLTLKNANPNGGDFTFLINRAAGAAQYTATYTSPTAAKVGATTATINFFGAAGGTGALVATATENVTITANGGGIGDVAVVGNVKTAAVDPGQGVVVGSTQQLVFTVKDGSGNVLAVTPGSGRWTLASGGSLASVTADGIATGIAPGSPNVIVKVDGAASPPTAFTVSAKIVKSYAIAEITGAGGVSNATVFPSWVNIHGDVSGYFYTAGGAAQTAFLWKNGAFTQISPAANQNSIADCVTDSDIVAGETSAVPNSLDGVSGAASANLASVFEWQGGTVVFSEPGTYSSTPRVNSKGQMIRTLYPTGSYANTELILRTNGTDQNIAAPSPDSNPTVGGLNDSGLFVGNCSKAGVFGSQAMFTSQGATSGLLGTGTAVAINTLGHIAGSSGGGGNVGQASVFLIDASGTKSTIANASVVTSVNNLDQVVGEGTSNNAIIWQNGATKDLNTLIPQASGWVLTKATHINNNGVIVGYGKLNGVVAAFILTPSG